MDKQTRANLYNLIKIKRKNIPFTSLPISNDEVASTYSINEITDMLTQSHHRITIEGECHHVA